MSQNSLNCNLQSQYQFDAVILISSKLILGSILASTEQPGRLGPAAPPPLPLLLCAVMI